MKLQKKHDQLIVLDFDHTLFNTTVFLDALQSRFEEQFQISPKDFHAAYIKARAEWAAIPTYMPHDDKTAVAEAMRDVAANCGEGALYPDAKQFLDRHKEHFDLLILTRGHEDLQQAKIEGSGLADIPHTVVQGGKAASFASLTNTYTTVYFIDDASENIDEVKQQYSNVIAYCLKRADDDQYHYAHGASKLADKEIQNLDFTLPAS